MRLLLLLAACGSSTLPGPFDTPCAALAAAQCQKRNDCTGGAGVTRLYGDMATCLAREKLQCTLASSAPDTGASADEINGCVAVYATYSCADFFNDVVPQACVRTGTRASSQPCAFAAQCQSNFCVDNKNSLCGSCGAPPLDGTPCNTSGCYHDQSCTNASMQCVTYGMAGSTCDESHPCGYGLSCPSALGMCAVAGELGDACNSKKTCDPFAGVYCGGPAGMKTCTAESYGGDGAPCGALPDGSFANCKTGGCYTASGIALSGQAGNCKASALEGAACDTVLGPTCLQPARCVTGAGGTKGVCTLPNPTTC